MLYNTACRGGTGVHAAGRAAQPPERRGPEEIFMYILYIYIYIYICI